MTIRPFDPTTARLLEAILPHVAFDGWSQAAFEAALGDAGLTSDEAKAACPRGAADLAVAFHLAGDDMMRIALQAADLGKMRYSERVAFAIRTRLNVVDDKEAVRRGTALFSLPHLAAEGARLIWGTADAIWTALGDTSDDVNWYTKRATLSGVYGASVLYWLGDDSLDGQATDDFIDRRIADVMQFETLKAQVKANPVAKRILAPLDQLLSRVRKPSGAAPADLPGRWVE